MGKHDENKAKGAAFETKAIILTEILKNPMISRIDIKEKMKSINKPISPKDVDYHIRRGDNSLLTLGVVDKENHLVVSRKSLLGILKVLLEHNESFQFTFKIILGLAYISPFGERALISREDSLKTTKDWKTIMRPSRGIYNLEFALSYIMMALQMSLNYKEDKDQGNLKNFLTYFLGFKSEMWIIEESKKIDEIVLTKLLECVIFFPTAIEGKTVEQLHEEIGLKETLKEMRAKLPEVSELDQKHGFIAAMLFEDRLLKGMRYGSGDSNHLSSMWELTQKINVLLESDIHKAEKWSRKIPIIH